jgi:pSer/pThr/pTyr-binding forkhead associated (FHA) protein
MTHTPPQFVKSVDQRGPYVRPTRPTSQTGPRPRTETEDEYDRTIAGVLPSSPVTGTRSTLQFFNSEDGRWVDLGKVSREGKVLGRGTFQEWDPNPQGLAEEHIEIGSEGDELYMEPLETLNGVYRRIPPNRREELAPGTRFRIGRHVLEFRLAGPPTEIPPLRAADGEVFQARVLAPLGFIDLLGPNGRPYLSFPVTKREERGTRIGRAGVECDVALAGDEWVSLRHARVFLADGKWWIEDLESTNGTYLIIRGRAPLRRGTTRHPASGDELLVGGYKIRVIEETG